MRHLPSAMVGACWVLVFSIFLFGSNVFVAAQRERILHVFGAQSSDGALPLGGLIADAAGNLYGTTTDGGGGFCFGTVYQKAPQTGTVRRATWFLTAQEISTLRLPGAEAAQTAMLAAE